MSDTTDIQKGLAFISDKAGEAPLVGIGLSMGANVMMRYVGLSPVA